jgi:hypothetical protein
MGAGIETPATGDPGVPGATAGGTPATPATLDLEGVTEPDEALKRLLAYADAKLAEGPTGHMELVRTLDTLLRGDAMKRLFDDDTGPRIVYPMLKFAVTHEGQMVALTETVFRTMADDPAAFSEIDDDTLEVFAEGFSVALPGAVGEETLARFRAHGKKILDTPEGSQPESVRKSRGDIARAMGYWAPLVSSSEAVERLRRGEAAGQEVFSLLRRVTPEGMAALDLGSLLGPLVESGDSRAIFGLRSLRLDASAVAALDARLIAGAAAGKIQSWTIPQYLEATGRGRFADARSLLERGLARGEKATEVFAQSLMNFGGQMAPTPEFVQWVLSTYTLNEALRKALAGRFPAK